MDMLNVNIGQSISTGSAISGGAVSSMSSGTIDSSVLAPADLIAGEHLSSELAALEAQISSAQRATSVANVADGALGQMSELLIRARGLTVSSASTGGKTKAEIAANQMELRAINDSINRIASTTTFAGRKLFDGNFSVSASGAELNLANMNSSSLGSIISGGETYSLESAFELGTSGDFVLVSQVVEKSINDVATQRGHIGAFTNSVLSAAKNQLSEAFTQISSARSAIIDTDYAAATSDMLRKGVFSQVTTLLETIKLPETMSAKEMMMQMLNG